ncbi:MAG: flagellar hook-length control protein FliK [Azoarcus sp.]|jgi:hypothetical protein|nr:flagellar hook-length control protein FliK [Azoarcus sp.]
MIPSDLAARLRFLHEANLFETSPPVAGLQRAREIQAQLQDLVPGQRFFATLQRTLPDGTFRALVAGQQVTLSLNASAKPGDTLELIATATTPRMVTARLANPETVSAGFTRPTLSQTGRLISFLLTGQPEAKPAVLANNQPLLNIVATSAANATNAVNAAQLAPLLRQALAQSGLFYESHQIQWLAGKIDLATLMREPQAQGGPQPGQAGASSASTSATLQGSASASTSSSPPSSSAATASAAQAATGGLAAMNREGMVTATSATAAVYARAAQATGENEAARANVQNEAMARAPSSPVAERLLPLVHQQLDALATQQYAWHGMAWPGQPIEWIVEDPRDDSRADAGEGEEWNTTLRLTLPRLGGVEARLCLSAAGVALRFIVDDAATASALDAGREKLVATLEAADVPLIGMVVERKQAEREHAGE